MFYAVCLTREMPTPKEVVHRFRTEGRHPDGRWNMKVIAECFDLDRYYSHTWGGNLAETGERQSDFFSAFAEWEPLRDGILVAEGDYVVASTSSRVRHVAPVLGVPATDRVIEINHVEMWRIEDGKIVEHWGGLGEAAHLFGQITAG
jgi:predicted SnoaL-like aldol condensation-catalyzing enzyme